VATGLPRPKGRRMFHPMLARYSAAALAVGATFFFKLEIEARVGEAPPFLLYLSAVTVSAWAGGLGPGPLAQGRRRPARTPGRESSRVDFS
jgi:hypothetical protein